MNSCVICGGRVDQKADLTCHDCYVSTLGGKKRTIEELDFFIQDAATYSSDLNRFKQLRQQALNKMFNEKLNKIIKD